MRARLEDLPAEYREQAREQLGEAPRETKFRNQVVELDGERFDSKWELRRYQQLLEQQACGYVYELRHHVEYALHVRRPDGELVPIGTYTADFTYKRYGHLTLVVEDTKSEPTRRKEAYRWKAKHFETEYGLRIIEVLKRRKPKRVHV